MTEHHPYLGIQPPFVARENPPLSAFLNTPLPDRPYFSCEDSEFQVIDQADMAALLRGGTVVPWMKFQVGENNVLESRPVRIVSQLDNVIELECADATLTINFVESTARKAEPGGETYAYMGGLEDANAGLGWISAG